MESAFYKMKINGKHRHVQTKMFIQTQKDTHTSTSKHIHATQKNTQRKVLVYKMYLLKSVAA